MTRKDYVRLAEALKEAKRSVYYSGFGNGFGKVAFFAGIALVEDELVRILKSDNPRFNEERFREAANF